MKVCSGNCRVEARCSGEENLVAKGEAVAGKGFRRTGDDEVDDEDERVSARDRIDSERLRPVSILLILCWAFSAGLLVGLVGCIEVWRSDGSEA
jgi:hypothetical protein